ncbi:MAG: Gldg family protein [Candidatus Sumerlaeota bacterium]
MVKFFGKLLKMLPILGAVLVAAAVWRSLQDGQMDQISLAMIGLGFLAFMALMLKIEAASLRYYLNLGILAALAFLNGVLLYGLASNHEMRWDLTRNARQSLAPETQLILQNLSMPVRIEVFAASNEPYRSYFQLYEEQSPFIEVHIINPRATVGFFNAEENEEVRIGDIRVSAPAGDDRRVADPIRFRPTTDLRPLESKIINAIAYVVQERATRLYMTSGHGEKSPQQMPGSDVEDTSIKTFSDELTLRGMETRMLNLESDGIVPDDCDILAIIGPTRDFMRIEIKAIEDYLERGGSLFVCIDPPAKAEQHLPALRSLIACYGIFVRSEMIVDPESFSSEHNALVPLIREFTSFHPITEGLQAELPALPMQIVSALEVREEVSPDLNITPLLLTSPASRLLSYNDYADMIRRGSKQLPPATERRRYAAAMALGPKPGSGPSSLPRMAVFGDSDFLTNAQLDTSQLTVAYRAISWLTDQDIIRVSRPLAKETPLVLSREERMFIALSAVVAIPFAVFFGGLAYTTIRRRKR